MRQGEEGDPEISVTGTEISWYGRNVQIRVQHLDRLQSLLSRYRVVGVLGARQVGKTTLARQFAQRWRGPTLHLDLEDPRDRALLDEPMLALEKLRGLIVLDEIQQRPELFPVLRVLADRPRASSRFLILGSASPELLRQTSESLAGRIAYYELHGFGLEEVGSRHLERLWLRGGFPRSFLARSGAASAEWRRDFVRNYLVRDLPQLGVRVGSETLRRFCAMLAHYHGQIWNASEFARAFGVADTTVRHYLEILTATFVVRTLLPWHENVGKRQVKSPKVYFADTGLLHTLLGLETVVDLERHPKLGASWEAFALQEVVGHVRARWEECFFWRTHMGAELDLLIVRGRRRWGFEFKRTDAPSITPSMRAALADLRLDRLDVVHAGKRTFAMGERIRAVALERLLEDVEPWRSH